MPLAKLLGKRERPAAPEPEEMAAPARQPLPVEDEPRGAGRPHQAFVEDEARKYWQEMRQRGGPAKPDRQTIREAAKPILRQALQKRMGSELNPALGWGHSVVNAMQVHLAERGLLRGGYTRSEKIPNYIDALLQLADDAGWLYREIPLPDHPAPRHPPIYYTVDPKTGKPVPTEKSWIRGDYVYNMINGSRLTQDEYIYPWRDLDNSPSLHDLTSRGWNACYTFYTRRTGSWDRPWDHATDGMRIIYFWISNRRGATHLFSRSDRGSFSVNCSEIAKGGIYFSPRAPTAEDLRRRRMKIDDVTSDKFLMKNYHTLFS